MIEGRDLQERSWPRELQEHEVEGHSLTGRWVNSHELRAGDWIITRSGTRALITEIRQHFEPAFPVSNLTIFGHHNYSVGDVGVLVHNVSVCDGTIADLREICADGMSEDKIKDWLRGKTDDNGNRLYNDDEIEKALEEILAPNKTRWDYIKEWHDKRATELFGNKPGQQLKGREYDKHYKGRDIEYKSDNFSKGPRSQDSIDRMNRQITKDIENLRSGTSNPHWHFEHDPRVAPEMAPLLKRLADAGIKWTWGSSTPSL